MRSPTLTEHLNTFAAHFRRYQHDGVHYMPETCTAFAGVFEEFAARSAELEQAEASLREMEAVAHDLDVVPHLRALRTAVVSEPGSNVLAWPITPRPVPSTGGDAA